MSELSSTVIMKTDLANFTNKVAESTQADLTELLNIHKNTVTEVVAKNSGNLVKGEGDSFWIIFPSVTTAAISAVEIQQELHLAQAGLRDEQMLKVRIAISLGDVLHQEGDIFGDAVNLAARIESVTPPDEIYLSHCAWLALNKAEVGNSFVQEYQLKGINQGERVYKIDQRFKTRIIENQIIIFTDLAKFGPFIQAESVERVESVLWKLEEVMRSSCEKYGGIIRQTIGDAFFITITEVDSALQALDLFNAQWQTFLQESDVNLQIRIGVSKGTIKIYRAFIYGQDVNTAARLEAFGKSVVGEEPRTLVMLGKISGMNAHQPT